MTPTLDPNTAEAKARELLNTRIASVRALVTARQHVSDLREQLAAAERADVTAYAAALKDGWTAEELRTLSLGEPDKRARVRRRAATRKASVIAASETHDAPADAEHTPH